MAVYRHAVIATISHVYSCDIAHLMHDMEAKNPLVAEKYNAFSIKAINKSGSAVLTHFCAPECLCVCSAISV